MRSRVSLVQVGARVRGACLVFPSGRHESRERLPGFPVGSAREPGAPAWFSRQVGARPKSPAWLSHQVGARPESPVWPVSQAGARVRGACLVFLSGLRESRGGLHESRGRLPGFPVGLARESGAGARSGAYPRVFCGPVSARAGGACLVFPSGRLESRERLPGFPIRSARELGPAREPGAPAWFSCQVCARAGGACLIFPSGRRENESGGPATFAPYKRLRPTERGSLRSTSAKPPARHPAA